MEYPDSYNDEFLKQLKSNLDDFKTQAPEGLWEGIAHELDHGTDVLDDSLKAASAELLSEAPAFLWSNIESSIGPEMSVDDQIDEKLRTAVAEQRQAPEYIWYGIEQNLNLDQVWNDMQPRLDKMRSVYLWRKRFSYISIAAAVFLLIRGCGIDTAMFLPEATTPVLTEYHVGDNQNQVQNKDSKISTETQNKDVNTGTIAAVPLSATQSTNKVKINSISGFPPLKSIAQVKQNLFRAGSIKLTQKTALADPVLLNALGSGDELNQELSSIALEKRKFRLFEAFDSKIKATVLPVADLSETFNNPFKVKYDIGLIAVLNSAVLINDQNTKKLNGVRADNISSNSNLSFSYGLQVAVKFAKRHSLISEFWFDSKIKQEYRYYFGGRLHTDQAELNYVKVNLSYRPQLFTYGKNSIVASSGVYLSNLKSVSYSSSVQQRHFSPAAPNLWDAGISLGIGQDHEIGKSLLLEYGLRNEIGISSIFQTSRFVPVKTNLLGFGAYVSMRYRF